MRLYDLSYEWNITFFDGAFDEDSVPVIIIEPLFNIRQILRGTLYTRRKTSIRAG
jgi:hypothetical protein